MTPDQLLTFATVAELGNISHAAQALHLSQPAVSGQLRLLQESFGEPLYRRDGRGIRLTAVGEQVAVYANKLRQDYRQAMALRDSLRGMKPGRCASGRVRRRQATCCPTRLRNSINATLRSHCISSTATPVKSWRSSIGSTWHSSKAPCRRVCRRRSRCVRGATTKSLPLPGRASPRAASARRIAAGHRRVPVDPA